MMLEAPSVEKQAAFWERVDVGAPDACWDWKLSVDTRGYGRFHFKTERKGKLHAILAHRMAWVSTNGPILRGRAACVLHKCDNRRCCNPAHLFVGTDKDNVDDMWAKGRAVVLRGAQHGRAKVAEHVNEIRMRLIAKTDTAAALAREFGVTNNAIQQIAGRNGRNSNAYRWVPHPTSFLVLV